MASNKNKVNQFKHKVGNLEFEKKLWVAADKLRGQVDSGEYKNIVLGLIFLKYISEEFEESYHQLELFRESSFEQQLQTQSQYLANHGFQVPKSASFSYLYWHINRGKIGETVNYTMIIIEK